MDKSNVNELSFERYKKKKKKYIIFLAFVVLIFGIGYALLQSIQSFTGSTRLFYNTWDVHWDLTTLMEDVSDGVTLSQPPSIDESNTSISFEVSLYKPGDYAEISIEAKNMGSLDAMVSTITKEVNDDTTIPSYLDFTVTYDDDVPLAEKQYLRSYTYERYKIRVGYKKDITANLLPGSNASLNIEFSVQYVQADNTATGVVHDVYNISSTPVAIGEALPNNVAVYHHYQFAMNDFEHPFFLRHKLSGTNVSRTMIGFSHQNYIYYLETGGSTYNAQEGTYQNDSIYYQSNKEVLDHVFGINSCGEEDEIYYECTTPDLYVFVSKSGLVKIEEDGTWCIGSSISSSCYYIG